MIFTRATSEAKEIYKTTRQNIHTTSSVINITYIIYFYLLEMGFGPLGTPCSLTLNIFPSRHVIIGRRTLNLSLLLPSGEVTATSLTCWALEPVRWVWSLMVLWWVWRISERKKKRTSEMMMWGDLITCYTNIRSKAYIIIQQKQQRTKREFIYFCGLFRIEELLKDEEMSFEIFL